MAVVSQMDMELLLLLREHITHFLQRTGKRMGTHSGKLLEIGPQGRSQVQQYFNSFDIDTFDIVDTYNPTIVGDITKHNVQIPADTYDLVVCMDVIEHTLDPFGAVREMRRILKQGGILLISAPLNLRIHGPIPDCWRFTEHGFMTLLRDFAIIEIDILESPGRDLFPVHYNIVAENDKSKCTKDSDLQFRYIE